MIRTQGLAYAYAGGTALRFDDVLVPQGGVLLLKGPSGAGKSTWLALAAGLVAPTQGQIEVADEPLAEFGRREKMHAAEREPGVERPGFEVVGIGLQRHEHRRRARRARGGLRDLFQPRQHDRRVGLRGEGGGVEGDFHGRCGPL